MPRGRGVLVAVVGVVVGVMLLAPGLVGCAGTGMGSSQQAAADWLVKKLEQSRSMQLTDVRPGVREDWTTYRDTMTQENQVATDTVEYAEEPAQPPNMDPTRDPKNGPFYFTAKVPGTSPRAAFVVWRDKTSAEWQYVSGPGGP